MDEVPVTTEPVVSQPPIVTPPTKTKKGWLWWILGLVIILAIGAGIWWMKRPSTITPVETTTTTNVTTPATTDTNTATTRSDLTTSWQTYTNSKYGFSFKYPKEWESTKKEETTEPAQGISDLVLKVSFSDPDMALKISCAFNESQNWKETTPTKTACDPILSKLTVEQKNKFTSPKSTDNIFVRIYQKDPSIALKDWLYNTFHLPDTELQEYQVGAEIILGGEKGYFSSIGCCASVDRNYVVTKGDFVYSLGSNYFESSISDPTMPITFQTVLKTFNFTTPNK